MKQLSQVCENYEEIKNQYNTEVLGVSVDDVENAKEFRERLSLPFPLLSDFDGGIINKYDVVDPLKRRGKEIALSANVIINKDGDVAYFHKGTYKERPRVNDMIKVLEKL